MRGSIELVDGPVSGLILENVRTRPERVRASWHETDRAHVYRIEWSGNKGVGYFVESIEY